jgi:hypothetical protein
VWGHAKRFRTTLSSIAPSSSSIRNTVCRLSACPHRQGRVAPPSRAPVCPPAGGRSRPAERAPKRSGDARGEFSWLLFPPPASLLFQNNYECRRLWFSCSTRQILLMTTFLSFLSAYFLCSSPPLPAFS